MIWGVAEGFEIKATWGRSFKAPTLIQQYQAGMLYLHPGALYAGAPDDSTILLTWGGNESLEPERAEVRTVGFDFRPVSVPGLRSEQNTAELQSLMRISYAVLCLQKKTKT